MKPIVERQGILVKLAPQTVKSLDALCSRNDQPRVWLIRQILNTGIASLEAEAMLETDAVLKAAKARSLAERADTVGVV